MKEEYLHYIFRTKQLGSQFSTTDGKNVEILDFGIHNHNSGPDFLECKIRFDDKIWAGQIEFHVKSSDWLKHKHQFDSNYNNVIAHFVYEHDTEIESGGYILPTIEIKSLINESHFTKYKDFIQSKNWIACENDVLGCDDFVLYQQKEKALFNRLQRKSTLVVDLIENHQGDRKKAFIILLFKAFGTKVNQSAFEVLGTKFDWKIISKLNHDNIKIQAYLFGLAGFLAGNVEDDHFNILKEEFAYLKSLYKLSEMNKEEWKFSTMRPSNLPTVRLAQLSQMLQNELSISESLDFQKIKTLLKTELKGYWLHHYMFGRNGKIKNTGLTSSFIDLLLINVFVPYYFAIGQIESNEILKEKVLDWLNSIKPEKNAIIKKWKSLGVKSHSAFDTQGLIEQKNEFCNKNLCLQCKVGLNLLKSKSGS